MSIGYTNLMYGRMIMMGHLDCRLIFISALRLEGKGSSCISLVQCGLQGRSS